MGKGIATICGFKSSDFPRVILKTDKLKDEILDYEHDRLILVDCAITTWERFNNFDDSVCHMMNDGRILRYGRQIGTRDDIEIAEAQ